MRYLYFCNSAYQLINILNLHWHHDHGFEDMENYSADLMIQNSFDEAENIADTIRREKIFDNVFLINKVISKGRFHFINSVYNIISPSYNLKANYAIDRKEVENRYDVICVPKFSPVIASIWQLNKKADLNLHEDGAGSYFAYFDMEMRSKSYKLFYRLFNQDRDFYNYKKIYINCPEFYIREEKEKTVEIPDFNEENLTQIRNCLLGETKDEESEKDIFWFSQTLKSNSQKESFESDESLIYLEKYRDRVLYFPHPRNPVGVSSFDQPKQKQIWEIRALNIDDIEDKLLISVHSTACLTPKILFDKEPYVILLYKMVINHNWPYYQTMDQVIELFRQSYSEPEKVIIPENFDEYKKAIELFAKH